MSCKKDRIEAKAVSTKQPRGLWYKTLMAVINIVTKRVFLITHLHLGTWLRLCLRLRLPLRLRLRLRLRLESVTVGVPLRVAPALLANIRLKWKWLVQLVQLGKLVCLSLQALLENMRLGKKLLSVLYALIYYTRVFITFVKSFMIYATCLNFVNNGWDRVNGGAS
jgi:hypothetical protein